MPADRAAGAAAELAESWAEGALEYQIAKDILGGWLTDHEPRPKLIADTLAGRAGLI